MNFLVQTIDGKIVHDFVFALQQAEEYFAWYKEVDFEITYHEGLDFSGILAPDSYIPVGSVEYVSAYLRAFYPSAVSALRPINVPKALMRYASSRGIKNITDEKDARRFTYVGETLFRKSLSKIKDQTNGIVTVSKPDDVIGYQVSRIVDFVSEWRVFVFQDAIRHMACYIGDALTFPSRERIEAMVKDYSEAGWIDDTGRHGGPPVAYTLDIGVTSEGKTDIIECHRFFSCGLYGFNDPAVVPFMLSQAWFEIKNMR